MNPINFTIFQPEEKSTKPGWKKDAKAKKYKAANFKRFLLSIHDKDMDVQQQLLSDEFDRWKGELEQIDDVCVMGVRV